MGRLRVPVGVRRWPRRTIAGGAVSDLVCRRTTRGRSAGLAGHCGGSSSRARGPRCQLARPLLRRHSTSQWRCGPVLSGAAVSYVGTRSAAPHAASYLFLDLAAVIGPARRGRSNLPAAKDAFRTAPVAMHSAHSFCAGPVPFSENCHRKSPCFVSPSIVAATVDRHALLSSRIHTRRSCSARRLSSKCHSSAPLAAL